VAGLTGQGWHLLWPRLALTLRRWQDVSSPGTTNSEGDSAKYDGSALTETTGYVLGTNPAEQRRLQQQSLDFAQQSAWLLDQTGIESGWRVIDVGCGPRGVLDLMAARVGPSGRVVGLEQNAEHAALAQTFATEQGLEAVTIVKGDVVGNDLTKGSFDLAHERTVLTNVPDPEAALRAMVELVRPGGVVACQDPDQSARVCDPPHPAWDRLTGILLEAWRRNGADPFLGRRLPRMMRRAGLDKIAVNLYAIETGVDHPRRFTFLTFIENLRETILVGGLIPADELACTSPSLVSTAQLMSPAVSWLGSNRIT
jgi:ubiquinone/menaquinone biosynthesis C-methylase UbiE